MSRELKDGDYQRLLRFRDALRQFLDWSGKAAIATGLTPAQHQLLLVIRAHRPGAPTINDVVRHLLIRHHSAVQLVDRAEQAGLVLRRIDADDHRFVRLQLTTLADERLRALAELHVEELDRLGRYLNDAAPLEGTDAGPDSNDLP